MPFVLAFALLIGGEGVALPEGRALAVTENTRVAAGSYVRAPLGERGESGVIVIDRHDGVTLDLTGVELRGAPRGTPLDELAGFGIVVRDSENVTIRGGTLGGFRGCIVAERALGLVVDGVTFDEFHGMRLRSTPQAEDESDWLFPHENDAGEWLANYGAAISITNSRATEVKNCRARHGQNGLLLVRADRARVFDNDFSFLSGWGVALYRTSECLVGHNALDYCVRGFSDGVYWRGQDSAAILMFERCSRNVFAYNTGTHSGDGVFLFAGQDTVAGRAFGREPDAGGSDRNTWLRNDFSFAVANGIEATFSRDNTAIENRLNGCHQHGVWGGYSRELVLAKNEIHGTRGGAISVEHGQQIVIANNSLKDNEVGVELWWDEDESLVKGPFGQHRDTSSRDTFVARNTFFGNTRDLVLRRTLRVKFGENTWGGTPGELVIADSHEMLPNSETGPALTLVNARAILAVPDGAYARGVIEGSTLMRVRESELAPLAKLDVFTAPDVPGTKNPFAARAEHTTRGLDAIVMGEWGPWDFVSGEPRPVQRAFGGALADATWSARWFAWKNGPDPREDVAGWRALAERGVTRENVRNFTEPFAGDAAVKKELGTTRFGVIARTNVKLDRAGRYRLRVTSDDGVRVTLDGKVALENWTWHAPTRDEATIELSAGEHAFALEYFQMDGALALAIELERPD